MRLIGTGLFNQIRMTLSTLLCALAVQEEDLRCVWQESADHARPSTLAEDFNKVELPAHERGSRIADAFPAYWRAGNPRDNSAAGQECHASRILETTTITPSCLPAG